MMDLMSEMVKGGKGKKEGMVVGEGREEGSLKGGNEILREGVGEVILLGKGDEMMKVGKEWGLGNMEKGRMIEGEKNGKEEEYGEVVWEVGKKKGMRMEEGGKVVVNGL